MMIRSAFQAIEAMAADPAPAAAIPAARAPGLLLSGLLLLSCP
jgi:hypothetical protein